VNTVSASFNTIMGQMTNMSQRKKTQFKYREGETNSLSRNTTSTSRYCSLIVASQYESFQLLLLF